MKQISIDIRFNTSLIPSMQKNNDVPGRKGSTRRAFLSASAVTAVTAPLLISGTALAGTAPAATRQDPDSGLRALLREIDPDRIKATILRLVQFGTRHTASSQTDPVRGIGAAFDGRSVPVAQAKMLIKRGDQLFSAAAALASTK